MNPISDDFITGIGSSLKYQTFAAVAPLLIYLVGYVIRRCSSSGSAHRFNFAAALALLFIGITPVAFLNASMLRLGAQVLTIQMIADVDTVLRDYAIACKYDPSKRQPVELEAAEQRLHRKNVLWTLPGTREQRRAPATTEPIPCNMVATPDLSEIRASRPVLTARAEYMTIIAYVSSVLSLAFVLLLIYPPQRIKRVRAQDRSNADGASEPPKGEPPTAGSDALSSGAKW
ncbi:hypothetical protein [Burkholderia ubonensis]|uniref:hypothetical protein n=1 Tax=Burkholderia ubonensis TaxID=101571 RepID=UPI000758B646|nr:hypothetical protein [Burkholderia ubonensis]KVV07393.1 hypothetical protein WK77_16530 [Burkholderia ubonensis]